MNTNIESLYDYTLQQIAAESYFEGIDLSDSNAVEAALKLGTNRIGYPPEAGFGNPALNQGYPGTTGIKTGYTDAAGRCIVATATHGAVKLGVVLLDSPDPGKQAMQLLDRGFEASAAP